MVESSHHLSFAVLHLGHEGVACRLQWHANDSHSLHRLHKQKVHFDKVAQIFAQLITYPRCSSSTSATVGYHSHLTCSVQSSSLWHASAMPLGKAQDTSRTFLSKKQLFELELCNGCTKHQVKFWTFLLWLSDCDMRTNH